MTDYEYQDLLTGIGGGINEQTALFVSIFVAYVICMHLVGNSLTKFQLACVSSAYSVYSLLLMFLVVRNLNRFVFLASEFRGEELHIWTSPLITGPVVMFFSWLISIVFMLQVRKKAQGD